ncbi:tetratricopeptide repeat protein [Zhouia amylolytica]|uniref:Uncharacterized protein n=1 Tax=Zhouia amylolytica AD3 TaxID=1286632 RepID=W2UI61_9FLAO|nr:tetratricopeptide repeat protein [Zhouia amylolytica]ETN93830.1 hypothetical protein P278_32400 [Zhouia amylolytica AD3]
MKPFLFCFVFGLFLATAQDQDCTLNLQNFYDHARVNDYEAAYEPWKIVYEKCPSLNFATFYYGKRILDYKIDNTTGDNQKKYVNDLLGLYDNYIKYFPDKYDKADYASDKALLMNSYALASDEEMYAMLDDAFKTDRKNFKNFKGLYLYFSLMVDLHDKGTKDLQEVFDSYDEVTARLDEEAVSMAEIAVSLAEKEDAGTLTPKEEQKLNAVRKNGTELEKIIASVDGKLGNLADCDKLVPLYEKNFESKSDDATWLKRALYRLDNKDCSDGPIYVRVVEALHQLEPSASSAYGLGTLNDKKGNTAEALKFYNEAVALEADPVKKSNLLIKIASKYSKSNRAKSYDYAQKAIDANPANGNAYLLQAYLYGNSANECGSTTFEKKAVYWRAALKADRAAQVDPSIKSKALNAASRYRGLAPSRTEIFNADMAGKSIQLRCWIGGVIKVPNLD